MFTSDGTPVSSPQNLEPLCERRRPPPILRRCCCRRRLFILHLPSFCLEPGVLPRPAAKLCCFPHRPPSGLLQRAGQRGLHRKGHQQQPARAGRLSRTVSVAWGAIYISSVHVFTRSWDMQHVNITVAESFVVFLEIYIVAARR